MFIYECTNPRIFKVNFYEKLMVSLQEGIAPKAYIHFDQTHFRYNLMKAQGGESLRQDEENPPEELILRLTGVIGSSSLPPVYELPK